MGKNLITKKFFGGNFGGNSKKDNVKIACFTVGYGFYLVASRSQKFSYKTTPINLTAQALHPCAI
jgi:hypothetical protein